MEEGLNNANNPFGVTNGSTTDNIIAPRSENLLLGFTDKLKHNGSDISPTEEHFEKSNGKRTASEFDDDDFGPETNVDAVDDLLSPGFKDEVPKSFTDGFPSPNNNPISMDEGVYNPFMEHQEKAALETEKNFEKGEVMDEYDDEDERMGREETPTPPADTVNELSGLVDNPADSESEDEWNYIKGDDANKENISPQPDKEVANIPEEEDNMSQLNPNAAEFVPVSPTRSIPSPACRLLMNDTIVAQSPKKANEVDISLPNPNEFAKEVKSRPSEIEPCNNGHSDENDHASNEMIENILNGKNIDEIPEFHPGSTPKKVFQNEEFHFGPNAAPFSPKLLDHSEALSTKAVFGDESVLTVETTFNESNVADLNVLNKESDPMSMSFYADKGESNPFDLNKVQQIPDDLDAFLSQPDNNDKFNESISDLPEHYPLGQGKNNDDAIQVTDLDKQIYDDEKELASPLENEKDILQTEEIGDSKTPEPTLDLLKEFCSVPEKTKENWNQFTEDDSSEVADLRKPADVEVLSNIETQPFDKIVEVGSELSNINSDISDVNSENIEISNEPSEKSSEFNVIIESLPKEEPEVLDLPPEPKPVFDESVECDIPVNTESDNLIKPDLIEASQPILDQLQADLNQCDRPESVSPLCDLSESKSPMPEEPPSAGSEDFTRPEFIQQADDRFEELCKPLESPQEEITSLVKDDLSEEHNLKSANEVIDDVEQKITANTQIEETPILKSNEELLQYEPVEPKICICPPKLLDVKTENISPEFAEPAIVTPSEESRTDDLVVAPNNTEYSNYIKQLVIVSLSESLMKLSRPKSDMTICNLPEIKQFDKEITNNAKKKSPVLNADNIKFTISLQEFLNSTSSTYDIVSLPSPSVCNPVCKVTDIIPRSLVVLNKLISIARMEIEKPLNGTRFFEEFQTPNSKKSLNINNVPTKSKLGFKGLMDNKQNDKESTGGVHENFVQQSDIIKLLLNRLEELDADVAPRSSLNSADPVNVESYGNSKSRESVSIVELSNFCESNKSSLVFEKLEDPSTEFIENSESNKKELETKVDPVTLTITTLGDIYPEFRCKSKNDDFASRPATTKFIEINRSFCDFFCDLESDSLTSTTYSEDEKNNIDSGDQSSIDIYNSRDTTEPQLIEMKTNSQIDTEVIYVIGSQYANYVINTSTKHSETLVNEYNSESINFNNGSCFQPVCDYSFILTLENFQENNSQVEYNDSSISKSSSINLITKDNKQDEIKIENLISDHISDSQSMNILIKQSSSNIIYLEPEKTIIIGSGPDNFVILNRNNYSTQLTIASIINEMCSAVEDIIQNDIKFKSSDFQLLEVPCFKKVHFPNINTPLENSMGIAEAASKDFKGNINRELQCISSDVHLLEFPNFKKVRFSNLNPFLDNLMKSGENISQVKFEDIKNKNPKLKQDLEKQNKKEFKYTKTKVIEFGYDGEYASKIKYSTVGCCLNQNQLKDEISNIMDNRQRKSLFDWTPLNHEEYKVTNFLNIDGFKTNDIDLVGGDCQSEIEKNIDESKNKAKQYIDDYQPVCDYSFQLNISDEIEEAHYLPIFDYSFLPNLSKYNYEDQYQPVCDYSFLINIEENSKNGNKVDSYESFVPNLEGDKIHDLEKNLCPNIKEKESSIALNIYKENQLESKDIVAKISCHTIGDYYEILLTLGKSIEEEINKLQNNCYQPVYDYSFVSPFINQYSEEIDDIFLPVCDYSFLLNFEHDDTYKSSNDCCVNYVYELVKNNNYEKLDSYQPPCDYSFLLNTNPVEEEKKMSVYQPICDYSFLLNLEEKESELNIYKPVCDYSYQIYIIDSLNVIESDLYKDEDLNNTYQPVCDYSFLLSFEVQDETKSNSFYQPAFDYSYLINLEDHIPTFKDQTDKDLSQELDFKPALNNKEEGYVKKIKLQSSLHSFTASEPKLKALNILTNDKIRDSISLPTANLNKTPGKTNLKSKILNFSADTISKEELLISFSTLHTSEKELIDRITAKAKNMHHPYIIPSSVLNSGNFKFYLRTEKLDQTISLENKSDEKDSEKADEMESLIEAVSLKSSSRAVSWKLSSSLIDIDQTEQMCSKKPQDSIYLNSSKSSTSTLICTPPELYYKSDLFIDDDVDNEISFIVDLEPLFKSKIYEKGIQKLTYDSKISLSLIDKQNDPSSQLPLPSSSISNINQFLAKFKQIFLYSMRNLKINLLEEAKKVNGTKDEILAEARTDPELRDSCMNYALEWILSEENAKEPLSETQNLTTEMTAIGVTATIAAGAAITAVLSDSKPEKEKEEVKKTETTKKSPAKATQSKEKNLSVKSSVKSLSESPKPPSKTGTTPNKTAAKSSKSTTPKAPLSKPPSAAASKTSTNVSSKPPTLHSTKSATSTAAKSPGTKPVPPKTTAVKSSVKLTNGDVKTSAKPLNPTAKKSTGEITSKLNAKSTTTAAKDSLKSQKSQTGVSRPPLSARTTATSAKSTTIQKRPSTTTTATTKTITSTVDSGAKPTTKPLSARTATVPQRPKTTPSVAPSKPKLPLTKTVNKPLTDKQTKESANKITASKSVTQKMTTSSARSTLKTTAASKVESKVNSTRTTVTKSTTSTTKPPAIKKKPTEVVKTTVTKTTKIEKPKENGITSVVTEVVVDQKTDLINISNITDNQINVSEHEVQNVIDSQQNESELLKDNSPVDNKLIEAELN